MVEVASSGRDRSLCRQRHLSNIFLDYRSRTRTLNPNPKTDPNPNRNPKNNNKENETGIKLNNLKVDFIEKGEGL